MPMKNPKSTIFPGEQKQIFREILEPLQKKFAKKYSERVAQEIFPEMREGFLTRLEIIFLWLVHMQEVPSEKRNRERRMGMLKTLRKASRYLKQITSHQLRAPLKRVFDEADLPLFGPDFIIYSICWNDLPSRAKKAQEAIDHLLEPFSAMERNYSEAVRRGRPSVITAEVIKALAFSYAFFFKTLPAFYDSQKPIAKKNGTEGGVFYRLCQAFFGMAEIEIKDVRRSLTSARMAIKKSFPKGFFI
jgi:hypothetical protein